MQSVRHFLYEFFGLSRPGRRHHLLVAAALQPVGDVVPHGAREQHRLLPDHSHLRGGSRDVAPGGVLALSSRMTPSPLHLPFLPHTCLCR